MPSLGADVAHGQFIAAFSADGGEGLAEERATQVAMMKALRPPCPCWSSHGTHPYPCCVYIVDIVMICRC